MILTMLSILYTIIESYVNIKILKIKLYKIIYIGQKLVKTANLTLKVFPRLIHTIIRYNGAFFNLYSFLYTKKNHNQHFFLYLHGDQLQHFTQLSKVVVHRIFDNNRIANNALSSVALCLVGYAQVSVYC